MKFAIKLGVLFVLLIIPALSQAESFANLLRNAAMQNGVLPPDKLYNNLDSSLAELGRKFFNSLNISLNGNISCQTCHLTEFNSADGLPNAVGVGGKGHGFERLTGGGRIIPRNTFPLWGRGGIGFDTFFWDGKVDFANQRKISQFGDKVPSADSLITAVHLPIVEIDEMLIDDDTVRPFKTESSESATEIYKQVLFKVIQQESLAISHLAEALGKSISNVQFLDIARSLAAFIRSEFRIKPTKFHKFLFEETTLTDGEIKGGLIFYGKGKCSICHSGPYFSDLKFHAIPFPQLGFGKNGFGVDYGRFNVTLNPDDLYKFRTPPLYNVSRTAPYGHSGSIKTLQEAIKFHFDPLGNLEIKTMEPLERHEYYKKLAISSENILFISYLEDEEIQHLEAFLQSLEIEIRSP